MTRLSLTERLRLAAFELQFVRAPTWMWAAAARPGAGLFVTGNVTAALSVAPENFLRSLTTEVGFEAGWSFGRITIAPVHLNAV